MRETDISSCRNPGRFRWKKFGKKGPHAAACPALVSLITAGFIAVSLGYGAGNSVLAAQQQTGNGTAASETDAPMPRNRTADTDYGTAAMAYLQTIATDYPARTNEENARSDTDAAMEAWIADELAGMGYTVHTQEYVHQNYTGTNVYVNKPGNSDDLIVLGAHYDCVDTAGIDDNGSGVSVLLETARRFYGVPTDCSLQFVFFDNEEHGGYVGSYNYVAHNLRPEGLLDRVLCYLNFDSVGAGDYLFAYGGIYGKNGVLQDIWPWHAAQEAAEDASVDLHTLPAEVAENPDAEIAFPTPTRYRGSDHYYFSAAGIPYVYFEASRWCEEGGGGGNADTVLTCHYQSADPAFVETGGQIMHTRFDSLAEIERLLPGRLPRNLSDTAAIAAGMIQNITPDTPAEMTEKYGVETRKEFTADLASGKISGEEASDAAPEDTQPEVTERVSEEAEAGTALDVGGEKQAGIATSQNRLGLVLCLLLLAAAAAAVLALLLVGIRTLSRPKRRRRGGRRRKRRE